MQRRLTVYHQFCELRAPDQRRVAALIDFLHVARGQRNGRRVRLQATSVSPHCFRADRQSLSKGLAVVRSAAWKASK